MKKSVIYSFLSILILSMIILLLILLFEGDSLVIIIPIVCLFIMFCTLIYLIIVDLFVGYKEYTYENEVLLIIRNGKVLESLNKKNIRRLRIVFDIVNKDIHLVSFKCGKKRYIISLTKNNSQQINSFINGIEYKKCYNYWYYIISFFTH